MELRLRKNIASLFPITVEELRKNGQKHGWYLISSDYILDEEFIREFKDKVSWYHISRYQHLSEDFIREFKDEVDWDNVSEYQDLSESFIREFKDKVNWVLVSIMQVLSEDFIREFKDEVDWKCIMKYQRLSEDFIREFKDYAASFPGIRAYQKISYETTEMLKHDGSITCVYDTWLYRNREYKKYEVERTGLYECHDDYFIAYKGIRKDRYSSFTFRYKYEKGKTYESNCDCTFEENSFGLSAWTEEGARVYCNEKIIKVKVRYEDVGRVVHNGGKVRCFKFEVLD